MEWLIESLLEKVMHKVRHQKVEGCLFDDSLWLYDWVWLTWLRIEAKVAWRMQLEAKGLSWVWAIEVGCRAYESRVGPSLAQRQEILKLMLDTNSILGNWIFLIKWLRHPSIVCYLLRKDIGRPRFLKLRLIPRLSYLLSCLNGLIFFLQIIRTSHHMCIPAGTSFPPSFA
jgi:hypothetical protein